MPRDPRAYLWDVSEAVTDIQGFVAGLDLSAYATISHDRVWATIQTALPTLAETVQALLTELGEE